MALPDRALVLGRGANVDMRFDDHGVSRSHARITFEGDGHYVEDLESRNGTFLNGSRISFARLVSGDRIQLGGSVVARFAATDKLERDLLRRLVDGSTRDALTGMYNRAFFLERLGAELAYAQRHGTKVAVLLVDLDFFKAINDTHGHGTGDDVLNAVARAVTRSVRAEDVVARLGGEEFAILARAANRLDSLRLAERVREAVAALRLTTGSGLVVTVTISVGVARMDELDETRTAERLLELADARLYRAKASGRNSVCAA